MKLTTGDYSKARQAKRKLPGNICNITIIFERLCYTIYFNKLFLLLQIKSLKEKQRTISVASQSSQKSVRSLSMRKPKDLKRLFGEIWTQTKALCKAPYLKYTIITCLIQFGVTTRYVTETVFFCKQQLVFLLF